MSTLEEKTLSLNDQQQNGSSQKSRQKRNAAIYSTASLLLSMVLSTTVPQSAQAEVPYEGEVQRFTCKRAIADFCSVPAMGKDGIGGTDRALVCATLPGEAGSAGLDAGFGGYDPFMLAGVFLIPDNDRILSSMHVIFQVETRKGLKTFSIAVPRMHIRKSINGYLVFVKLEDVWDECGRNYGHVRRMVVVLDNAPYMQTVYVGRVFVQAGLGWIIPGTILLDNEGCGALIK